MTYLEDQGKRIVMNFESTTKTLLADMKDRFKISSGNAYKDNEVGLIMHQIFSLLAFFHSNGYVHRDIKPENFLFSSEVIKSKKAGEIILPNKLKLCSLSTMENMHKSETTKGIVGTYLFMAPEMISGKPYDTLVDMWSAGVIMYMLLTGEHPLVLMEPKEGRSIGYKEKILQALHTETIKPVDENKIEVKLLQKPVKQLLEQLLEVDPKKRITAERALRETWIMESWSEARNECVNKIGPDLKIDQAILHKVLMLVIYAVCAPTLKILLLDRMCNPAPCARENEYPAISEAELNLYKELFFYIDKNGNGFLSKEELFNCIFTCLFV